MTTTVVQDPEQRESSIAGLDALFAGRRALARHPRAAVVAVLGVAFSLFHLYTAFFGPPEAQLFRSTHVAFVLVLAFLLFPARWWVAGLPLGGAVDAACIAAVVGIQAFILRDIAAFNAKSGFLSATDVVIGTVYILLVLEATRRTVGWSMVITSLFFLAQAAYADRFPSVFYGPPTTWRTLVDNLFFQEIGIFGVPVGVMASYIVLFLLFGSLLLRSRGGEYFVALAVSLSRRSVGGPAKAAVVSSALFGTISGSAVANVMTTGSFTIPLMKRAGYRAAFAGGVEAVASSGGQIMPPVMGAAAFILAEFLGVPYLQVAKAAILPALLYFFSLWLMVHFEARRRGIGPVTVASHRLGRTLRDGGHLLLPLLVISGILVSGASVSRAGFWGVVSVVLLSLLRRHSRLTPPVILSSLADGARATVPVSVAAAAAGLIIGAITTSGVGARFTSLLLSASHDTLWLALGLTMLASFILGMGLTTSADYILLAILAVPALIKLGVTPLAAHLFAFYFSSISGITPPVALAAFAAAGIAGTGMVETGLIACRVGIASFLIPYLFVYAPAVLGQGSVAEVAWAVVTSGTGVLCLAASLEGWLLRQAAWPARVLLLAAAGLLIRPALVTDLAGLALLAGVLAWQARGRPRARARGTAAEVPLTLRAGGAAAAGGKADGWGGWLALAGVVAAMAALGLGHWHVAAFNPFLLATLAVATAVLTVLVTLSRRSIRNSAVAAATAETSG